MLQLTMQHQEIARLQAERDRLLDDKLGAEVSKDQVIQEARNERDMILKK